MTLSGIIRVPKRKFVPVVQNLQSYLVFIPGSAVYLTIFRNCSFRNPIKRKINILSSAVVVVIMLSVLLLMQNSTYFSSLEQSPKITLDIFLTYIQPDPLFSDDHQTPYICMVYHLYLQHLNSPFSLSGNAFGKFDCKIRRGQILKY